MTETFLKNINRCNLIRLLKNIPHELSVKRNAFIHFQEKVEGKIVNACPAVWNHFTGSVEQDQTTCPV